MRVVLVGLSHKTAPVQLREKLSLYGKSQVEALHGLRDAACLEECAILSTCNRMEFYALSGEEECQERILACMARQAGVTPGYLQDHLYSFEGIPAFRHLFRVAAGLDSMVMGERQILAQVKEALQAAREAETSGAIIHNLFQYAIAAGKRARTETEIGRGAVSISLAAVRLAKQIFERLSGLVVLLVGAGETGEQTAKMLLAEDAGSSRGAPRLLVCNRTLERAEALAAQFGGTALPYDRLREALGRADIVIASTGAPHTVVGVEDMKAAMRARHGRPIFLIDIAVPRDVEPDVEKLDDVYLYNIDDLQEVVEKSLAGRQAEAGRVEALLEEDLKKFQAWLRGLEVGPTIQQLQRLAEQILDSEQARVGGRLSHLSQRDREVVDTLVRGVVNKLLRPPILHLKEAANSGNGYHEVENVRAIFGLDRRETGREETR
ncbi:MAG TPA: glutamyl-tRNA reductase [Armatimonadota bacterium]|nr:glutamyl-tRNA reductase [Armatimonadota bacterium]